MIILLSFFIRCLKELIFYLQPANKKVLQNKFHLDQVVVGLTSTIVVGADSSLSVEVFGSVTCVSSFGIKCRNNINKFWKENNFLGPHTPERGALSNSDVKEEILIVLQSVRSHLNIWKQKSEGTR